MKKQFFLILLTLGIAVLASAQTTQTFSNPAPIIINQVGHSSSQYPSSITVSGMPARLHEFVVRFDVISNAGLPDADILLETPDGQRLILMSDLPLGGIWWFNQIGIGTTGKDTISSDNIYNNKDFRPANYDTGADNFPAPGPGAVTQPKYPDALVLQDINPNGTWKLYIEDDAANTADLRLQNGWSIEITAAAWNVCKRPGVPQLVEPSDFGAKLSWSPGAGNSTWDVFFTQDLNFKPLSSTPPTNNNLTQNQNVFAGGQLEPAKFYAVWVRADCGGTKLSPWVGPTFFQTTIHPCDLATPVKICQAVDYPLLPSYYDYFFNAGPTWTFAFTAPEAGEYFMEFEGNSGYAPFYRLDNANNCDDGQWTEMESLPGVLTFRLPLLAAGQTCWIIHHNVQVAHDVFRIVRCPLRRLVFEGYNNATDSLNMIWQNWQPITDPMEFVIGKKPLAAPDENTQPTLAGVILPPTGEVSFKNLEPNTTYQVYARPRCASGEAGCWQGPFEGKTGKLCSKVTQVQIDTVTEAWGKTTFHFTRSGSTDPADFTARVCRPGQNPVYDWVGEYGLGIDQFNLQNDSLTMLFHSLPLSKPLQFYLKAYCWTSGFGAQPWQGPYELPAGHTPPLPVDDLFCGEGVANEPYHSNENYLSIPNPCNPYPHASFQERLFRYRSNADDTLALRWYSGFSLSQKGDGVAYFVKSASLPLDSANWQYVGCWKLGDFQNIWDPANWPDIRIPVKKDSVYHILCDAFNTPGVSFPFFPTGCQVTCPGVDTLILDTATSTTATLHWNSAGPGVNYKLDYWPDIGFFEKYIKTITTTDTSITLTGLWPSMQYRFLVRTFCSPTDPSQAYTAAFQLKDHWVEKEFKLSRCNPHFLPPGDAMIQNFEVFEVNPTQSGDYVLMSGTMHSHIYDGAFDSEKPLENLLASVTDYGINGRKDTLLNLQAGEKYLWVVSSEGSFDTSQVYPRQLFADGPAPLPISEPRMNGRELKPHGRVPNGYYKVSAFAVCPDTAGWMHFYSNDHSPWDTHTLADDRLLLSLKGYSDALVLSKLPLEAGTFGGVVKVTSPPAEFLLNPDGWYEMNRYWLMANLTPAQQIDSVFAVRTYYTDKDFQDLKTAVEGEGGHLDKHEELFFHKINGFHDYTNVSPFYSFAGVPKAAAYDELGYWEYKNGPVATTSEWRHGTHGNDGHYAEMVIRGFSGGGGGASVNGKSAFDAVSKTTDPNASIAIRLVPNPNAGVFTIELLAPVTSGTTFRVTDLAGRFLFEKTADVGSQRQTIEATALPEGMYFLQVAVGGTVVAVKRFVKF